MMTLKIVMQIEVCKKEYDTYIEREQKEDSAVQSLHLLINDISPCDGSFSSQHEKEDQKLVVRIKAFNFYI